MMSVVKHFKLKKKNSGRSTWITNQETFPWNEIGGLLYLNFLEIVAHRRLSRSPVIKLTPTLFWIWSQFSGFLIKSRSPGKKSSLLTLEIWFWNILKRIHNFIHFLWSSTIPGTMGLVLHFHFFGFTIFTHT